MIKSIGLRVNSFIAYRNGKLGGFTKLLLCLCVPVLLGAAVPLVNGSLLEKDRRRATTISARELRGQSSFSAKSRHARKPLLPTVPLRLLAVARVAFLAQRFLGR
jgi:hypothetical protein